ncbi:deaminated glutathione amidase isoform 3-T3 [Rhynchonycteris naso]
MAVSSSSWKLPLVAVCQVTSTPDKQQNFKACAELVREAARLGACLAFLPEAFDFIARDPAETLHLSEPLGGNLLGEYAQLARECGLWLSLGGFHERGQDWEQTQKIYNCHVLLNNKGSVVATYRKTHLCDVEIPGQGPMRESNTTLPGPSLESPVSTPAGKVGLAICYDMRFPELSLALAQAGAEILTYPSAFGSVTGPAHWEAITEWSQWVGWPVTSPPAATHLPRRCCGPVPLKPSAMLWQQHSVDATMRKEQVTATAWWWIPGEQWWPAALRDPASALPELTSVTCNRCANSCLCSSTAGLISMAIWVNRDLKTFNLCELRPHCELVLLYPIGGTQGNFPSLGEP